MSKVAEVVVLFAVNSVLVQWDYHHNDDHVSTSVVNSNPHQESESPNQIHQVDPQPQTTTAVRQQVLRRQHSQRCLNSRPRLSPRNEGLSCFYYKANGYWRKRSLPLYVCDPSNPDTIPMDCENKTFIEGRSNDSTEIKISKMLNDFYIFQNSQDGMEYDAGDEVLKEYIIDLNWNFYDCKTFFGIGHDRFARICQDQRVSSSIPLRSAYRLFCGLNGTFFSVTNLRGHGESFL